MEEERRNCFVAITRVQETLHVSLARTYNGYEKKPSRFLKEMGFQFKES
jgi:DNA helicase-2/ATP-dependent DNA helicase PcrA